MDIGVRRLRFYSEGALLDADLYFPESQEGNHPAILLCHGYMGVKNLYLPDTARALAADGNVVLTFDYKGWGESEGSRYRLAPFSRVADTIAAVTALSLLPEVDVNRISVLGWSYGASVAVVAAAMDPRIQSVISVFGVSHGERWMRSVRTGEEWGEVEQIVAADRVRRSATGRSAFVPRLEVIKLDAKSMEQASETRAKAQGPVADVVPLEFFDDTLGFHAEWFVAHISPRPILVLACDHDEVVPVEESTHLFEAAAEPKTFHMLEGLSHYDAYFGDGLERVTSAAIRFLAENALTGDVAKGANHV